MKNILNVERIHIRIVDNGTDGLIAWVSCTVFGAIKLDNMAVRRGRDGALFLSFPAKKSADGSTHQIYHPISREASKALHDAVLTRLAILAKMSSDEGIKAL